MMRTTAIEDPSVIGKIARASVRLSITEPCMAGADSQQVGRFELICEGKHVPISLAPVLATKLDNPHHANPLQSL
jgi:hypothetical protein